MKAKDYTFQFTVEASAHEVFDKINSVSKWWTEELEGSSKKLNDEFTVRFFDDVHVSTQKIVELVPDKKIVWLVTKSKLNFIKKQDEWTGTKIVFEIAEKDNKTQVQFTHIGLVPEIECYEDCTGSGGWERYLKGSLVKLLKDGKGVPELK